VNGGLVDFFMVCVSESDQVEEFFRFSVSRCKIEADLSPERIRTGLLF